MKGKVKFFNEDKAYGFITGEDGKDYFVHVSGVNEGVKLNNDTAVTFDIDENGDRGVKAVNVSLDNE
ncbi:MAG: cold-shock protein [Candidatus Woesearchaeota archaeon]